MMPTQLAAEARGIALAPPERARVLVVDDEPQALRVFSAFLAAAGMDVVAADSGERALELLEAGGFETVVSDLRMPGIDGFALLRAIRARDGDLPVVVITGCPAADTPSDALELGAIDVLVKPVAADLLVRTVSASTRLCRLARFARQAVSPAAADPAVSQGPGPGAQLSRALQTLYLAWQPVVRAHDGQAWGQEAFVRTLEPSLAGPDALFSAADRLGRSLELGRTARRAAAADRASLGTDLLFVNVHPSELADDDLLDAASPLSWSARSVVLELTDRTPLAGVAGLREKIGALRTLGFRVGVDDVGSGGESLNRLALVEPDFVKLGASVVRGLDRAPERRPLVASMTRAFHDLGIRVVATGVETPGEQAAAEDAGVDYLQGFLFGRPKPVSAAAGSVS